MLFDLRGKRKRVIQVIYAGLALLMGVGLIGFGIGSDASGGLFTCNDRQSAASADLVKRADELQAQVQASPKDEQLWLQLVRARVQAGNAEAESDPQTGQQTFTEDGIQQLEKAADAWESYLKLKPDPPSDEAAVLVAQSYFAIAQTETDLNQAVAALEGAADAEQVFADARPSQGAYAQLATYLYLSGQFKAGKKAEDQALEQADPGQRPTIKRQLEQPERIGRELQKQLKQQAKLQPGGGNPLQNPLGGLGSSGGLSGGTP
jgi:hypothetical protein